jgi:hypothetical protein
MYGVGAAEVWAIGERSSGGPGWSGINHQERINRRVLLSLRQTSFGLLLRNIYFLVRHPIFRVLLLHCSNLGYA